MMELTNTSALQIKDFPLEDQVYDSVDVIEMRRQYWKLDQARQLIRNENETIESEEHLGRPVTCLLYPGLTPGRLYDHLKSRCASDACILEWTRRLQILRRDTDKKTKAYGIKMLAK